MCVKREKDDIYIEEMRRHLYGTVAVWLGDNLGSHAIGGFLESFSGSATSRLCRFCNGTREMMRSSSGMSKFTMRTPDEYDMHVSLVAKYPDMRTLYGVKLDSPLNKLQYFHVVSGLPPDIMHDVREGVLEYELPLIVSKFVMDDHFSLEWLNIQLRTWDYGPLEARYKPVEFPKNLQSKHKLAMNAGRMWCLIRLLSLMVYSKVPHTNLYMRLLLLLAEIMSIVFAPRVSKRHVSYLDALLQDHHQLCGSCPLTSLWSRSTITCCTIQTWCWHVGLCKRCGARDSKQNIIISKNLYSNLRHA